MNGTKEHILKTSLLLFLQKSYRDVTMKEIVKKTGLSKGAFYHYFNSKEELFKEIVNVFFSMGIIDYSVFNQDSLHKFYNQYIEHIGASFGKMYEFIGCSKEVETSFNFFLIIFEAVSRFPEFLSFELEQHNKEVKAWEKVISRARKTGEIKSASSDAHIANLFLYCTDGVFIRFINNDKNSSYEANLLNAFDTIYNNLRT
jgi:TetR/AcrR family transcriptional repressor of nem operon